MTGSTENESNVTNIDFQLSIFSFWNMILIYSFYNQSIVHKLCDYIFFYNSGGKKKI